MDDNTVRLSDSSVRNRISRYRISILLFRAAVVFGVTLTENIDSNNFAEAVALDREIDSAFLL